MTQATHTELMNVLNALGYTIKVDNNGYVKADKKVDAWTLKDTNGNNLHHGEVLFEIRFIENDNYLSVEGSKKWYEVTYKTDRHARVPAYRLNYGKQSLYRQGITWDKAIEYFKKFDAKCFKNS